MASVKRGYPSFPPMANYEEPESQSMLEQLAKRVDVVPVMLNFTPLRSAMALQLKRARGGAFSQQQLLHPLQAYQEAREGRLLYRGSWSAYSYMAERATVGAVQDLLVRATREEDKEDEEETEDASGIKSRVRRPLSTSHQVGVEVCSRALVCGLFQPLSNVCTFAILYPKRLGPRAAYRLTKATLPHMWHAAPSRIISSCAHALTSKYLVAGPARSMIVGDASYEPHDASKPYSREEMRARLNVAFPRVYSTVVTNLVTQFLVFPLETIRFRREAQYMYPESPQYSGWLDAVRTIYRQEGIAGFYRGIRAWAMTLPLELGWPVVSYGIARALINVLFEDEPQAQDDGAVAQW